jgi:hypothetical protein
MRRTPELARDRRRRARLLRRVAAQSAIFMCSPLLTIGGLRHWPWNTIAIRGEAFGGIATRNPGIDFMYFNGGLVYRLGNE